MPGQWIVQHLPVVTNLGCRGPGFNSPSSHIFSLCMWFFCIFILPYRLCPSLFRQFRWLTSPYNVNLGQVFSSEEERGRNEIVGGYDGPWISACLALSNSQRYSFWVNGFWFTPNWSRSETLNLEGWATSYSDTTNRNVYTMNIRPWYIFYLYSFNEIYSLALLEQYFQQSGF